MDNSAYNEEFYRDIKVSVCNDLTVSLRDVFDYDYEEYESENR